MLDVPLLDGWTRLIHMLALVMGPVMIVLAIAIVRRKASATDDAKGPGSVSWTFTLGLAGVIGAIGAGLVWMPYQFARGVRVTDDALELRYLFPHGGVRVAYPAIEHVTLVEGCELSRSGWRTRSRVELSIVGGRTLDPIEGERATLVQLANALGEHTGHPPRYEVRNRDLSSGACITESPWPDAR